MIFSRYETLFVTFDCWGRHCYSMTRSEVQKTRKQACRAPNVNLSPPFTFIINFKNDLHYTAFLLLLFVTGIVVAISMLFILLGVIVAIFFMSWFKLIINHVSNSCKTQPWFLKATHLRFCFPQELILKKGSQTFEWWAKPPVVPTIKVYVYNVTNADEFLNNGSKPIVDELGPYVYV